MRVGKLAMAMLFIAGGCMHFLATRLYASVVPGYLPAHRELVLISGAVEVAAGAALLMHRMQRVAAWTLIALLIAIFPANLWMAQHPELYPFVPVWTLWVRLPLQAVLIWWAWLYTRPAARPARLVARPQ